MRDSRLQSVTGNEISRDISTRVLLCALAHMGRTTQPGNSRYRHSYNSPASRHAGRAVHAVKSDGRTFRNTGNMSDIAGDPTAMKCRAPAHHPRAAQRRGILFRACLTALASLSASFAAQAQGPQPVLQRGYDGGVTGAILTETTLNTSNVNA